MSTCQERVISSPQEGGGLDSMAPCGLFQLYDSDSLITPMLIAKHIGVTKIFE